MNDHDPLVIHAALDRSLIALRQRARLHLAVELNASEQPPAARPPISVVLAIDVSGSMEGEKLRHALHSAELLAQQLEPGDRLGLVTFSNSAWVLLEPTPMKDGAASRVRAALASVRAGGGTHLEAGLRLGQDLLRGGSQDSRRSLVILSDGAPNAGETTPRALAAIARAGAGRVTVSTLGYGKDHSEAVLGELAEGGGGTYAFVAAPELCRRELARAVGIQAELVADDVRVRFEPARGIEVERVLGLPRGSMAGPAIQLAGVSATERRLFAFVLQTEPFAELGSATLGHLVVQYRSAGGVPRTWQTPIMATVGELAGPIDPVAHGRRLICSALSARDVAASLAERGAFVLAEAELRQTIDEIRNAPSSASSPLLMEALEQLIDDVTWLPTRPDREAQRAFRRGQGAALARSARPVLAGAVLGPVPSARLVFLAPEPRPDLPLTAEMVLGRTATADVKLTSPSVSRMHARISVGEGGAFWLTDLGSSNTTLLNGRPVSCERLADRDVIGIGGFQIQYREGRS